MTTKPKTKTKTKSKPEPTQAPTPADVFVERVRAVLEVAGKRTCALEGVRELAEAINPSFPQDSLDVLEVASAVAKYRSLPSAEEIDIVRRSVSNAFGRPRLSLHGTTVSAELCGDGPYRTISLVSGNPEYALSAPLKVTVSIYADMDLQESHSDYCGRYYPEHEDGCPLVKLRRRRKEATEAEWKKAEDACECPGECNCEADVVATRTKTFRSFKDFEKRFTKWLGEALLYPEA